MRDNRQTCIACGSIEGAHGLFQVHQCGGIKKESEGYNRVKKPPQTIGKNIFSLRSMASEAVERGIAKR